jgi:hypothetical protein
MEKLPLSSVTVPVLVPFTETEAPFSGLASGSVTVPLIFDWAFAVEASKKKTNAMNAWLGRNLIFIFGIAVV